MIAYRTLSDSELVSGLKTAVSEERKQMTLVLEYLREVDRRRLYADYNRSSLWEFCVEELRYSEGAAQRRISAMRLLRELPELKDDLLSGKQNLSSLVQAQKFFRLEEKALELTREEKREVLKSLENLSTREGDKKLLAMSSFPAELARPEKERTLDNEHTELRIVVDASLMEKLKRIQAMRSHANPEMKYADLLNYLADMALEKLEKVPTRKSPPASAAATPTPRRRVIPTPIRRQIRAVGVCGYQDPSTGKRCESRHFLEIDHVRPVALGGTNEPDNLQLRCRAHNQRRAFQQGILKVPVQ